MKRWGILTLLLYAGHLWATDGIKGCVSVDGEPVPVHGEIKADPVITEIRENDDADSLIQDFLKRRKEAYEKHVVFHVPEFNVLIENIEEDINFCYSRTSDLAEQEAIQRLEGQISQLKKDNYPYKETVLFSAQYTMLRTLLNQARNPDLNKNKNYHFFSHVSLNDIGYDDVFYKIQGGFEYHLMGLETVLSHENVFFYPFFGDLRKIDFLKISPFKFYPLGMIFNDYATADDLCMSPVFYFSHDLRHAQINTGRLLKFPVSLNVEMRDLAMASLRPVQEKTHECLVDMFFNETHEAGFESGIFKSIYNYRIVISSPNENTLKTAAEVWITGLTTRWFQVRSISYGSLDRQEKKDEIRKFVERYYQQLNKNTTNAT